MAKPKMKKVRTPKAVSPFFSPDRHIGSFGGNVVVADASGKLWRLDMENGRAHPVKFENR